MELEGRLESEKTLWRLGQVGMSFWKVSGLVRYAGINDGAPTEQLPKQLEEPEFMKDGQSRTSFDEAMKWRESHTAKFRCHVEDWVLLTILIQVSRLCCSHTARYVEGRLNEWELGRRIVDEADV